MSLRGLRNFRLAQVGWKRTVFADNVSVKIASFFCKKQWYDEHEQLGQSAGRTQSLLCTCAVIKVISLDE
jgi:hypothetical protein